MATISMFSVWTYQLKGSQKQLGGSCRIKSFTIATAELAEIVYVCMPLIETSAFQSTDHLSSQPRSSSNLFR